MPPDGAFNGGAQSQRGVPEHELQTSSAMTPGEPRFAGSGRRQEAAIEGADRRGGQVAARRSALRAENQELRMELAELRTGERERELDEAVLHDFGELVNVAIPAGPKAPGSARAVVANYLGALVEPRVLQDAQLLISELVTNCLVHGQLSEDDTVLVRILLATDALRLEVENPGLVGTVATNLSEVDVSGGFGLQLVQILGTRWGAERNRSTNVWVEMEWA